MRKEAGGNERLAAIDRGLLTRDYSVLSDLLTSRRKARRTFGERIAAAALAVEHGRYRAALAALPPPRSERSAETIEYITDLCHSRLGILADEKGDAYADAFDRLHRDDVMIIATIQKSGTHWMRFFITNYARVLTDRGVREPIGYRQLVDQYYGNSRWQVFRGAVPYRTPCSLLAPYGVTDVTMQHFRDDIDPFAWSPGRKVMLYRNPLDYVISLYHYNVKQRKRGQDGPQHPRDVIGTMLSTYARHYTSLCSYRTDPRAFVTSYEQLQREPKTFTDVVDWLGLPVDHEAIETARELSDISMIRQTERASGRSMVIRLKGYFTRDGSIGQWKQFFDDTDLENAAEVLARYDIDMYEFDLE